MFICPTRVAGGEWRATRRRGLWVVPCVMGELAPQTDGHGAASVRRIEASTDAAVTDGERRNSLAVAATCGDDARRSVVANPKRGGDTARGEPKRSGSHQRRDAHLKVERHRPSYSFPAEQADDAGRDHDAVDRTTRSMRQHIGEPLGPVRRATGLLDFCSR